MNNELMVCIDNPRGAQANVLDGWIEINGWAAGMAPVCDIRVSVEGCASVRAYYGGSRPDVSQIHSKLYGVGFSGFKAFVQVGEKNVRMSSMIRVMATCQNGGTAVAEVLMPKLIRNFHENVEPPTICPCCCEGKLFDRVEFTSGPYRLYKCGLCGYATICPRIPQTFIEAIYSDMYWQNAAQRPTIPQEHYDSDFLASLIAKHKPNAKKIIEIGCGPGALLFGLNKRGYRVQGQDASKEAAKIAKEIYGLDVTIGTMAKPTNVENADVLIMRHVIEHSSDPCVELRNLFKMLQSHAVIIIITPNLECGLAQIMEASWEWFAPPIHLSYFSPSSLSMLASKEDLMTLMIETRKGDGIDINKVLPSFSFYKNSGLNSDLSSCAIKSILPNENEVIAVLQKK